MKKEYIYFFNFKYQTKRAHALKSHKILSYKLSFIINSARDCVLDFPYPAFHLTNLFGPLVAVAKQNLKFLLFQAFSKFESSTSILQSNSKTANVWFTLAYHFC